MGLLMRLQDLEATDLGKTEAEMVTLEDEEVAMVLTALSGTKVDVSELFGGGSFVEASKATALNLTPGTAYDLRTGFNLSDPKVRGGVWEDLERQKPAIVVGSPMCAAFSTLAAMQDKSSAAYKAKLREGLEHLTFCCAVYRWQHDGGRFFLHEHPHGAWSWKLPMMQAILSMKEQFGHAVHEDLIRSTLACSLAH